MKILDYFITESDAASILGVNRNTIARWAKDGKLEIQHVGRTGLIPKWQIELLRANTKKQLKTY
ncbi:helix-turn-helix domain-containing protein [Chloroflexota bacterium]